MVKKQQYKGKTLYRCEACNFLYNQEELALECEAHCRKHKSCSLEITEKAVSYK
ncbi:hypothetical protein HY494_02930 [Candidatus Woesearchaeota archaeon]|nr:hypothetical protein [Candidatus Woesearchaeota archaeon]